MKFFEICAEVLVPKFTRAEVRLPEKKYDRANEKCGEGDRKRRDIDVEDRYDRENPCRGVKQLTTGFANWVDRYIPNCSGQRDHSQQINRMKKWGERLQNVMQCDQTPTIEETDFGKFISFYLI